MATNCETRFARFPLSILNFTRDKVQKDKQNLLRNGRRWCNSTDISARASIEASAWHGPGIVHKRQPEQMTIRRGLLRKGTTSGSTGGRYVWSIIIRAPPPPSASTFRLTLVYIHFNFSLYLTFVMSFRKPAYFNLFISITTLRSERGAKVEWNTFTQQIGRFGNYFPNIC